jgi:hypothetical protein
LAIALVTLIRLTLFGFGRFADLNFGKITENILEKEANEACSEYSFLNKYNPQLRKNCMHTVLALEDQNAQHPIADNS